jgi:hypothetical protein
LPCETPCAKQQAEGCGRSGTPRNNDIKSPLDLTKNFINSIYYVNAQKTASASVILTWQSMIKNNPIEHRKMLRVLS